MATAIQTQILDLARWAPSGDNTQPWRFETPSDDTILVHGHDTRRDVIYDFDGRASHMAHGALLETIRLAATRFSLRAEWTIRPNQPDHAPIYEVRLSPDSLPESPLVQEIARRSVQRRAMRTVALLPEQKQALIAAVGDDFSLVFFESFTDRLSIARLLWKNAYLRLTCPEAYPVHRSVIEWNARYSTDRIPDQAVGVDPLTAKLMHWVMESWERVEFFNRYLGGTLVPRVQLDFVPALACAAHVLMKPKKAPAGLADHLVAGAALQRLWLTVSHLGLHLQPEMTPLIFRWYVQAKRQISARSKIDQGALELSREFEQLSASPPEAPFSFFCRIGSSKPPHSRSLRKELKALIDS